MSRLLVLCAVVGALVLACVFAGGAVGEQASEPGLVAAGGLDVGGFHSCGVLAAGGVRCWGFGEDGQLGYGSWDSIGDNEPPSAVGPVNLGGQTARAVAAGASHSCALLVNGSVRCWGFGGNGRLGYASTARVRDPGLVGAVDLGLGHTARAISAGTHHTCAVRDDGAVLCWGFGGAGRDISDGRLGYGNTQDVGDDETPGERGPVKIGGEAVAISAGGSHTCALLVGGDVRCWGAGQDGALGGGNVSNVGDAASRTPETVGPVRLGNAAVAVSAGDRHSCAVLDDRSVRCWGLGADGRLGYGNTTNLGGTPGTVPELAGPVPVGGGAVAVSAGGAHTCAVLVGGALRCWGLGSNGRLGYGNVLSVGDNETPATAGSVRAGGPAVAVSAGGEHTCARLAGGGVRCWGNGLAGRLGYGNTLTIGDDETPDTVGPVRLEASAVPPPPRTPASVPVDPHAADLRAQAVRARGLAGCRRRVARRLAPAIRRARRLPPARRARARRLIKQRKARLNRRCAKRWGRTPGRVTEASAAALSRTRVELSFRAAGTDGNRGPGARSYLIKLSRRPIRTARSFKRAPALCNRACRFAITSIGQHVLLTVKDLRPNTTHYFSVSARDNVTGRPGPRTHVRVSTR